MKGLTDYSDHCPLTLSLQISIPMQNKVSISNVYKIPPQYVWEENSYDLFLMSLCTPETTQACNSFMKTELSSNKEGIYKAVEYVNKLFANVSKGVIKRRQIKTGRKRKNIKSFMFGNEC